jgi:hypothetical protein
MAKHNRKSFRFIGTAKGSLELTREINWLFDEREKADNPSD